MLPPHTGLWPSLRPSHSQERQCSGRSGPAGHTLTCHRTEAAPAAPPPPVADQHYLSRQRGHCWSLPLYRPGQPVTVVWFAVEFTCRQQGAGEEGEQVSEIPSLTPGLGTVVRSPRHQPSPGPGFLSREARPSSPLCPDVWRPRSHHPIRAQSKDRSLHGRASKQSGSVCRTKMWSHEEPEEHFWGNQEWTQAVVAWRLPGVGRDWTWTAGALLLPFCKYPRASVGRTAALTHSGSGSALKTTQNKPKILQCTMTKTKQNKA